MTELLRGKTSVFVGQSGVGKSSLIQKLVPDVDITIGELGGVGKNIGAHTTSNARLYHIQRYLGADNSSDKEKETSNLKGSIGSIIDSPGIRELGIWHLSRNR